MQGPVISRKFERRVGSLESLSTKPKSCFARVRVDGLVLSLPLSTRGVLESDGQTIRHCVNGAKYDPIKPATLIVVDLVYDANGENPHPGMWAPKL